MAVQENRSVRFGTGRLYGTDQNGNTYQYGELQDVSIDVKIDIKEAYGEGGFPFAAADGHRSIDISAKHFISDLTTLANDLGGSTPAANTTGYVVKETGVTAHTTDTHYQTANANVITFFDITVGVTNGSITAPVSYAIVTAGTEVAGVSCSVNNTTGKITFATGETVGATVYVTYSYTLGSSAGLVTTLSNTFQNSAPTYKMTCIKRDASRLSAATDYEVWIFNAVRPGSLKNELKEGDFDMYDRAWKAFADPMGNVGQIIKVTL